MLSQKRQSYRILLNTMAIKHKIKFKIDRGRGTRDATGAPLDLSDNAKASDESSALDGESARRGVPSDENEYRCGGAYRAILAMFAKHFKKEEDEKKEK